MADIDLCHSEAVESRISMLQTFLQSEMLERSFTVVAPDPTKAVKTFKLFGFGRVLVDFSQIPCATADFHPARWPDSSLLPAGMRLPTLQWLIEKSISCLNDQV